MADDTTIKNAANVDEVISTDHVTTLNGAAITIGPTTPKVPRSKQTFGDDGTSRDVSAAFPLPVEIRPALLAVTITAAAGAAATLTLPAPAAGLFHYITHLELELYSTAARTGVAAPIVVTTTNLPGALAYTFETAGAIGTIVAKRPDMTAPLKSSAAATASTFAAPAVVGGLWRLTAHYYTAA